MKVVSLLLISMLLVSSQVFGEGERQPTLEELGRLEAMESTMSYMDELKVRIERASMTKRNKCMRLVGDEVFCACITENTPVGSSLEEYIVAVLSSDEELNFAHLKPQQQKLVTLNRKARNQCVNVAQ